MMTVHEVSRLTGLSIRTLQYYDKIGLLTAQRTDAGYRLYDDAALERLQQIMLFRELEFPLAQIRGIVDAPGFDRRKALAQQIELLTLRKQRLEQIIALASDLYTKGDTAMDFKAFDKSQLDDYAKRAKEQWGTTPEYDEFTEKNAALTDGQRSEQTAEFMQIFAEFGGMRCKPADCDEVQLLVERLQRFITEHYYNCTGEILYSLGQMYSASEEFRANIDRAGGEGTAEFVTLAITHFCGR